MVSRSTVISKLLRNAFELAILPASVLAAFLLRFNLLLPHADASILYWGMLIAIVVKYPAFKLFKIDRDIWRLVGLRELIRLVEANLIASMAFTVVCSILFSPRFPRSVYVIDLLVCLVATAAVRFLVRYYFESLQNRQQPGSDRKQIIIYGAGAAGRAVLDEIRRNPNLHYHVVAFVDDDPGKHNSSLGAIPIIGGGAILADLTGSGPLIKSKGSKIITQLRGQSIDEVLVAMPSATGEQMSRVVDLVQQAGLRCRTIPGLSASLVRTSLLKQLRDVGIEDLLGRQVVELPNEQLRNFIRNKRILVTGGGGSIGSELCRQLAGLTPEVLVILERTEFALYEIERELRENFPEVKIRAVLGDILDEQKVRTILLEEGIESIFHAAAYKHVPIVEAHPAEALRNNVLGTWRMGRCAIECGVREFVMISSDKAVRPTNVMGASKRAAELVVASLSRGATKFVSVRFGNVLGSSGSVVPLFKSQLAKGGPITVTHPDMERYFMTIPEAVQLVLQAAMMSEGGETFVLDMGQPVKIVDLARNLIRLSGLRPDEDIKIEFVGVRPGEKLYEELISHTENLLPTHHPKIKVLGSQPPAADSVRDWVRRLEALLLKNDRESMIPAILELVPEYQPSEHVRSNKSAAAATAISSSQS